MDTKCNLIVPNLISIIFHILWPTVFGNALVLQLPRDSLKPLTAALLPPVLLCIATVWCGCSVWVARYTEMMWEVKRAEIWFRGKFANVLTRVEGSEGNCERASLKKHSINWIHIKIRLPGEPLDDSNAFKKGVWAELKKIRPMNLSGLNSPVQKKN